MPAPTTLSRAALLVWCACIGFTIAALTLHAADLGGGRQLAAPLGTDLPFMMWGAAYASAGALVCARRPQNPIGWLLLAVGADFAVTVAALEYANVALAPSSSLPAGPWAAWVALNVSTLAPGLIGLTLLLFPDGRVRSRRWRRVAWLPIAVIVALVVGDGLAPGPVDGANGVANPLGIGSAQTVTTVIGVCGWALLVLTYAAAGVACVAGLRSSAGTLRQQVKWVAGAAALLGIVWVWWTLTYLVVLPSSVVTASLVVMSLAMCGIPAAIGVAVLRYRLYGIDVIIRRTLTYGALTALLALVYAGLVVVLEVALRSVSGQSGSIAVTISTLVSAALFGPLLRRIRVAVDRRFARSAYDATRTLAAFSGRLRDQLDIESIEADLIGVVRDTLRPAHAELWLRGRSLKP